MTRVYRVLWDCCQRRIIPKHSVLAAFSSLCSQSLIYLENCSSSLMTASCVRRSSGYTNTIGSSSSSNTVGALELTVGTRSSVVLSVTVAISEIQASFQSTANAQFNGNVPNLLVVPGRLKWAMLEPLEPLVYRTTI